MIQQPVLSIIIPTFNRLKLLQETLNTLFNQTTDNKYFEIIIVDDGSNDSTPEYLNELCKHYNPFLRYYHQENQYSGAARNLGIQNAKGSIILSLDDDIISDQNLIKEHLDYHQKYPDKKAAIIGRILIVKDKVDLLNSDERKILYRGKTNYGDLLLDCSAITTQNLSLKKSFIVQSGLFTPGLPRLDDMELSFRLDENGMQLIYNHNAICFHNAPLDTVQEVVESGKLYGQTLGEWYDKIECFKKYRHKLAGRFNEGLFYFKHYPYKYIKNLIMRNLINKYTINIILKIALKIPITNPPNFILIRLCKEIWSYYYRSKFYEVRHKFDSKC